MSKRTTRLLSLILTLVMFLSVATPAYAWGPGDFGGGWDRDIGEDEIRDPDFGPVEDVEEYDYFQALDEENNVQVTIEAPMGSLPSLAEVRLEPIPAADLQEAVEAMVEGNPQILVAMDISFWLGEDEIEPEEPVRVKISAPELEGKNNLQVIHFPDDEEMEPETVQLIPEEDLSFTLGTNEIAFLADSFSVYAVVGEDDTSESARVAVNFYNLHLKNEAIATVYVKNGDDAEEIDKIVYDPGIGEIFNTEETKDLAFMGWSLDVSGVKSRQGMDNSAYPGKNYNSNTTPMTIAQIKTFLESLSITEGDVINVYAIIFQRLTVTYIGANNGISLGSVAVLRSLNDDNVDYEVNMAFTAGAEQFFEGWKIYDVNEKSHIDKAVYQGTEIPKPYAASSEDNPTVFPNKTILTLNGDLTLEVSTPDGHWLVFNENGKGATYNAPMFIKSGETIEMPANAGEGRMTRNGYTFGGWYTDQACTDGNEFVFEGELTENTNIYAKWTAKTTSRYTVLVWIQNLNGISYDFYASDTISDVETNSIVSVEGTVGGTTATVGPKSYGAPNGFHLTTSDQNVKIVPEDTAVVNVYFDRTEYTLSFRAQNPIIYTESEADNANYGLVNDEYVQLTLVDGVWMYATNEYTWDYVATTSTSGTQYALVDGEYIELTRNNNNWYLPVGTANNGQSSDVTYDSSKTYYYLNQSWFNTSFDRLYYRNNRWRTSNYNNGSTFTGTIYVQYTGTRYVYTSSPVLAEYEGPRFTRQQTSGWQPIKTITALYGQVISDQFPIHGDDGRVYDQGERWKAQAPTHGFDEVIVLIDTMPDADIIFNLDESPNAAGATLYYYVEALPGAANTRTFEGKQYVLYTEKPISAKYNYVTIEDYLALSGFTKFAVANSSNTRLLTYSNDYCKNFYGYGTSQSDRELTVYFYYSRNKANILYNDGVYVDGKDAKTVLEDYPSRGTLKTVMDIPFGSDLSSYEEGGANYYAPTYNGFAFAGWYWDEACTQPASFTTLPQGGMVVFAKWVQVQFRVFLHPNVPNTDKSLFWGKDDQAMCFRISNGGFVSLPDGTRNDFEFVGWYLDDQTFDQVFNADIVALTTGNVTEPYNKETDMTDVMNKFAEIVPVGGKLDNGETNQTEPFNSDAIGYNGGDRFWITKRFDVYAKWKAKLNGAKGIDVIYDAGDGSDAPHDNLQYEDNSKAVAEAAATPPAPDPETGRAYQFMYWKVLKWNGTEFVDSGTIVYPGGNFVVLKANAQEEDIVDPDDPEHTKKYTIKLVAEYDFVDAPDPTYITWYSNVYDAAGNLIPDAASKLTATNPSTPDMPYTPYQDGAFVDGKGKGFDRQDVQINKAIPIPPATTYTMQGYTFLGWGKIDKSQSSGPNATGILNNKDLSDENLFLKWVPVEGETNGGHYEAQLPKDKLTRDYYIVGYINGADVGSGTDNHANLSNYKINKTSGKLSVKFDYDSYVFVKTPDNIWYNCEAYVDGTNTSATMKPNFEQKFFVPGGVQLTFELSENIEDDGNVSSVTLSYTTGSEPSGDIAPLNLRGGEEELVWKKVTAVAADEDNPYQDLYAVWGGEFKVYHSGIEGGAVETYQITRANKDFDLTRYYTEPKRDSTDPHAGEYKDSGFLYGGYYLDGGFTAPSVDDKGVPTADCAAYDGTNWTWNTAQTENGMKLQPKPGVTYYIKEVPADTYELPYMYVSYDLGTEWIANIWLVSAIDDAKYSSIGFIVYDEKDNPTLLEAEIADVKDFMHGSRAGNKLTITNKNNEKVTLNPDEIFDKLEEGYITYLKVKGSENGYDSLVKDEYVVAQYWITKDNVLVTGATGRTYSGLEGKYSEVTIEDVSTYRLWDYSKAS